MAKKVCMGAKLKCSMGSCSAALMITPEKRVLTGSPAATILDNKPLLNIPPFGMCKSPANPAVSAVIAASAGAQTQSPCIPVTVAPWVTGKPNVLISNQPSLTADSKLFCMWGGAIEITDAGEELVDL